MGRILTIGAAVLATTLTLLSAPAGASAATQIPVPSCCPDDEVAVDGFVFVMDLSFADPERATLIRIDPATDTITGQLLLPSGLPAGNAVDAATLTVAAGALWIPLFFRDEVLRVDPLTMRVMARVRTGRGPEGVVSVGTSVWAVLGFGSAVARIDPGLNAVTQTVRIGNSRGTDGPWQATYDGTDLLVSMPGSGRVAHVDPRRGRVTSYDPVGRDAAACAVIVPAPGGYWLDDTECGFTYYRWDAAAQQITAAVNPIETGDFGAFVANGALYTGQYHCSSSGCTRGYIVKYDALTGDLIARRRIGADATLPHLVGRSIWVGDWVNGAVQRLPLF